MLAQEVTKFVTAASLLWASGGLGTAVAGKNHRALVRSLSKLHLFLTLSIDRLVREELVDSRCCSRIHLRVTKLLHTHGLSKLTALYIQCIESN